MSHRAVFTLLLFAGFSLPCTHAGMTGLHAYTRSLSKCLGSPRASARGGSPGGAQFLCALEHVRGPFLLPSSQCSELCFMQLGPHLSRVLDKPKNARALWCACPLCRLLLCAVDIVSGRGEDRKLIAFQLRKLLQRVEAPVSHPDLHPTRSASQGEKSGSRRLLNDAGCTTLPSFFLITNACDGKGYCICSIYPQTLTRQKLFSAATFSPTAIEQNDPSTRFNSPKPPLPPNIKKLMSKFEALD